MTNYGYIRVCAGVPQVRVADVDYNRSQTESMVKDAAAAGASILVLPELGITGYTCGDLFEQPLLIESAERAVVELAAATSSLPVLFAVGCPVDKAGRRYNCAVVIYCGQILGIIPKTHIPNYGEFYERRWFESGEGCFSDSVMFGGLAVSFGTDLIFAIEGVKVGVEICEDLWVPNPPSVALTGGGADIILNLSASDELIGKHDYLRSLISQQSARCRCVYAYASAGWGESSTDLVFAGNAIIGEDGALTEPSERFTAGSLMICRDVDIEKLRNDRSRFSTYYDRGEQKMCFHTVEGYEGVAGWNTVMPEPEVDQLPFVPRDDRKLSEHCEEIINIQARGLMQRLHAIHCDKAVIGISGGLDSTLALLVTVRAFDRLGLDRKGIVGITMPGMATTSRTHNNAVGLMEALGVTSLEIPIGKAVAQHFSDIGQDPRNFNVTYENSQARERTQILMDYANKINAIVVGTGDLSELALGWCTYNGDHMSMYSVNSSVPKTLVKHLVKWFASEFDDKASSILLDIVDTPISPELVPSEEKDTISQKTEDLVGPYELHDFFIYHMLRNSFSPRKIFWLARIAFKGRYDDKVLLKWLRNFYRRFFNQQFKRSCMPDGPKVGSVCLSPRGDWRMPSDASSALWLAEVDRVIEENRQTAEK